MARLFLDSNALPGPIKEVFNQLEDQNNGGTQLFGLIGEDPIPKGIQSRDIVVHFDPETQAIKLGIFNGESVFYTGPL